MYKWVAKVGNEIQEFTSSCEASMWCRSKMREVYDTSTVDGKDRYDSALEIFSHSYSNNQSNFSDNDLIKVERKLI